MWLLEALWLAALVVVFYYGAWHPPQNAGACRCGGWGVLTVQAKEL